MTNIKKNILLIGRMGSGKSALANTLVNKEENFKKEGNFEEVFRERRTREIQCEEIEINGTWYRIIDTIGFGASLTEEKLTTKINEVYDKLKDNGLTQVLFVIDRRITKGEVDIYKALKHKFFLVMIL